MNRLSLPPVLFVCLGNICRSPLAEAAYRHALAGAGLAAQADSAGTGDWHVGHPPDPRAIAVAAGSGIDISHYCARQVRAEDFHRFGHIVALDRNNLGDLARIAPAGATARLSLLLDWAPGREGHGVADPYYGDEAGFAVAWQEVSMGARGLLSALTAQGWHS